mmetsp:Transcript_3971/g.10744  ORF Transcript_3971/g.10744 Transcript_3971/m.10744 type:complete len:315 (-) Transcript_3971:868-1812(-)
MYWTRTFVRMTSLLLFSTSGLSPSSGRRSCCFACSSRRATATALWASSSQATACSSSSRRLSGSAAWSFAPASFILRTTASASSTFPFTTSTMLARLRFEVSVWNWRTRSMPPSICRLTFSSCRLAASEVPWDRRPTSTIFRLMNFRASTRAVLAADAALSMACRASSASSAGIVSMPMRKGASVSRICSRITSTCSARSWASFRSGPTATRDCDSSTVRCALSTRACALSARVLRSSILAWMGPLRPAVLPEISRSVGARAAWATRSASLVSRISAALMPSGLISRFLASGSAIMAAFSQSHSMPASLAARSP